MGHAHHEWLKDAAADIERDYKRLFKKAARHGATQEVGHENEGLWVSFLTNWLPPQYEIAERRYIIGTANAESYPFETDIIIFHPGYPTKLREKKHVMAAGVAAAFSTKLTIRPEGLKEAAEQSAVLQRTLINPGGHSRDELWKPYVFGILAASHDWKSPGSTPSENMSRWLQDNDHAYATTPAESLDLACIADLGTWAKMAAFFPNPRTLGENEKILTSHVEIGDPDVTPTALFLAALYELLSWKNEDMRGIARDFRITMQSPTATGTSRLWDAESFLTDEALVRMRGEPFSSSNQLDSPLQGIHVHQ